MSETAYLYVRETSKPKGQRATRCPTDLNFPLVSRKGENGKELRKKDASVGVRFCRRISNFTIRRILHSLRVTRDQGCVPCEVPGPKYPKNG